MQLQLLKFILNEESNSMILWSQQIMYDQWFDIRTQGIMLN